MRSIKLILFTFLLGSSIIAQEISFELGDNLSQFYYEVGKENANKALELSKKIDSILSIEGDLDNRSSAIYNNAKGYIYNLNNLNPEPYFIKADSLNDLLAEPDINVKVFSSFLLGGYYFNNKKDVKSKKIYSKLIAIEDLPERFFWQKLKALQNTFFIERSEIYENLTDSLAAKVTAKRLAELSEVVSDTLTISYGNALAFIDKENEAEIVFHSINNIHKTDLNYDGYKKFQALNWLNLFYYRSINNRIEDTLNADKVITVSEELLTVVQGTDYMEPHNLYAVYGDLVVAGIIAKDKRVLDGYEKRIIDLLNQNNYPKNVNLDLKRFYYTLHKLKMFYEFDKNYEKAKFYALKNVELTKFLYGEISVEHEQELLSYQRIIQLKQFDYDTAFEIANMRGEIIKSIFGEESLEYLDLLNDKYNIVLNEFDFKEGLELMERAMGIVNQINCEDYETCDNIWLNYLESLNYNGFFQEALNETKELKTTRDYNSLFRISQIRRNSYYGLNNFIAINFEFEWLLNELSHKTDTIINEEDSRSAYFNFLLNYQEHLRSTGRLSKALDFSKKNFTLFENSKAFAFRNNFLLNYLNILLQMNECSSALSFIENNEILKFNNITNPISKELDLNTLQNRLGRIYNCLGDNEKAIEAYEKITVIDGVEQNYELVYMELSRLYNLIGNENKSIENLLLFEKNFTYVDSLDINILHLLVEIYNVNGNDEKVVEYLLPLSDRIMDEICFKSFFSSDDNKTDKLMHDEFLKVLLTTNNGIYYNYQLSANAEWISNLYKKRLDYYGQINLDIQRLKMSNNPDALLLRQLEMDFNERPSEVLKEDMEQLRTKLITSRISSYEGLCDIDFNVILNSINEDELVIDLFTYNQIKYNVENYAVNFSYKGQTSTATEIFLEDEKKLKTNNILDSPFFDYLSGPIFNKIGEDSNLIDTFYIIPSGKSNLINFSAFSIPFEEKQGREIKVHVINSLADIPKIKNESRKEIGNIILIGDIDFDKVLGNQKKQEKAITRGLQLTTSIEYSGIPLWGYLPGTKQEIEDIEKLAKSNHISTLLLRQNEVTESNLNKIILDPNKNNIVHIATHGFFFPDNLHVDTDNLFASHKNPLLRSGLILSGANENWNNKTLVDSNNDGILTAEEISFMDLSGVELVVLSACDTGLGDVSNLEGINGLQRAFKLAGANKLIMSLWKVPDEETAEFFDQFYYFLLQEKLSINKSFRETQKIMKQKYDPFYWASFVLLE